MGVHKNSRTITVRLPMDQYYDVLRCSGEQKMAVSNFALHALSVAVNPKSAQIEGEVRVYNKGYKEKVPGGFLVFIPDGKNFITCQKGVDMVLLKAALEKEHAKLFNKPK